MRLLLAVSLVSTVGLHAAQGLSLDDLLDRLDAYLLDYEQFLATVVAEERYEQTLTPGHASPGTSPASRTLRADYALWRSPGGHAWTGYRDVFEVDGELVRDRDGRLLDLLAEGSPTTAQQALRITRENARYNLAEDLVPRTINVPTVALDLIHPRNRKRFRFERRGEEDLDGRRAVVMAYEERGRPTLVRTPAGRDRPARGSVWIDPDTGAVLRTDFSWSGTPAGTIVVHYRHDPGIGALVPETMLETYRTVEGELRGRAVYTGYRRFQTGARLVSPR